MNNWFECKVSYEKMMDSGLIKRISEGYLIEGISYTEVEERLISELATLSAQGEMVISTIKRIKIAELFLSDAPEDDKIYRAKVNFISLDEKNGVEKRTAATMIIQSSSLPNAITRLEREMEISISPYEIASITDTPIIDVWRVDLGK